MLRPLWRWNQQNKASFSHRKDGSTGASTLHFVPQRTDSGFLKLILKSYSKQANSIVSLNVKNYKILWLMAALVTGGEVKDSISGRLLHE
jgi:hypothetical protein